MSNECTSVIKGNIITYERSLIAQIKIICFTGCICILKLKISLIIITASVHVSIYRIIYRIKILIKESYGGAGSATVGNENVFSGMLGNKLYICFSKIIIRQFYSNCFADIYFFTDEFSADITNAESEFIRVLALFSVYERAEITVVACTVIICIGMKALISAVVTYGIAIKLVDALIRTNRAYTVFIGVTAYVLTEPFTARCTDVTAAGCLPCYVVMCNKNKFTELKNLIIVLKIMNLKLKILIRSRVFGKCKFNFSVTLVGKLTVLYLINNIPEGVIV